MRMRRQRFVSASERALDIEMDSWDGSDERPTVHTVPVYTVYRAVYGPVGPHLTVPLPS